MYIVNGIVYGSEPSKDMEVTSVKNIGDYIILVTFSTGEVRLVDCTELFKLPAFKKIIDKTAFDTVKVNDGVLTWLDGAVDIAPESLYACSYEYPIAI
ncbi:MAG: DUF2442 domain-containing protein [Coriobacteriales bacterium]|nr:DUF2442 domain-containing protein [Coriobacteriales bacterium]